MIQFTEIKRTNLQKHRLSHQGRDNQLNFVFLHKLIYSDQFSVGEFTQFYHGLNKGIKLSRKDWDERFADKPLIDLNSKVIQSEIKDGYIYIPDFELIDYFTENLSQLSESSIKDPLSKQFMESRHLTEEDFIKYGLINNATLNLTEEQRFFIGSIPHPDSRLYFKDDDFTKSISFSIKNWNPKSSLYNKVIGFHTRISNYNRIKFVSTLPDFYISIINQSDISDHLYIVEGCMDAISLDKMIDGYKLTLSSGYATDLQLIQILTFIEEYDIKRVYVGLDNDNVGITNSYLIGSIIKILTGVEVMYVLPRLKDFSEDYVNGHKDLQYVDPEDYEKLFEKVVDRISGELHEDYEEYIKQRIINNKNFI